MKYIKKYQTHINEMSIITNKGKTVYADDKILKNLTIDELEENIVFLYNKKNTFFQQAGKFWMYFITDPQWTTDFQNNNSDLLLFPHKRIYDFTSSPITDVWKKTYTRKIRNSDMIIGIVEGFYDSDENKVYIQMMSTRPNYKRNTINKKLIDSVKNEFKDAKLVWEDPTEDGLNFIKNYSDDSANFLWSIIPPKNYKTLFPKHAEITKKISGQEIYVELNK